MREQVIALHIAYPEMTRGDIARHLGISKISVVGHISRARARGDLPPAMEGPSPMRERVVSLRLDHPEMTLGEIARRLGITRNSVVGHIDRARANGDLPPAALSLPSYVIAGRKSAKTRAVKERRPKVITTGGLPRSLAEVRADQLRDAVVRTTKGYAGQALSANPEHGCLWPIGDTHDPEFHFCGKLRGTKPYCLEHRAVAYEVPS